jgi:hypothetical protein
MGLFSLDWFKSEKTKQLEALKLEEQKIKNLLFTKLFTEDEEPQSVVKPYLNVKLVNSVLTVVLNDGAILSKPNATQEDFNKVRIVSSEEEILLIMGSEESLTEKRQKEAEITKMRAIQKGFSLLYKTNDFDIVENTVYLKEIHRSLPQLLVEKFAEIINTQLYYTGFGDLQKDLSSNEEYQSLKRFFMWCCLNPRVEVANELYRFLTENSFRITKQGFFVALRNVVTLHGSNQLVHFVSNTYNKVKAVWKKNPNDYTVFLENEEYKLVHKDQLYKKVEHTTTECPYCDGSGIEYSDFDDNDEDCSHCGGTGEAEEYTYETNESVFHGERIGILTDLYLDLPNIHENRFTDDWTKTFDIRIGRTVGMPMEECNWSTQDCAAAGLHFTSDQIHYVGCGDTSVLVLINPMKVVGIGQHKGRCYEYLPIMTVPREEATKILHDVDFDTLELDEDYAIRELENLADKAKEGFVAETKKYNFNIPSISSAEIDNIVLSLDGMKDEISKRISIVQ